MFKHVGCILFCTWLLLHVVVASLGFVPSFLRVSINMSSCALNAPRHFLWRPPLETIREEDHDENHEDEEDSVISVNFENVTTWRGTPSRRV